MTIVRCQDRGPSGERRGLCSSVGPAWRGFRRTKAASDLHVRMPVGSRSSWRSTAGGFVGSEGPRRRGNGCKGKRARSLVRFITAWRVPRRWESGGNAILFRLLQDNELDNRAGGAGLVQAERLRGAWGASRWWGGHHQVAKAGPRSSRVGGCWMDQRSLQGFQSCSSLGVYIQGGAPEMICAE
jgi:hypothetical protein